MQIYRFRLKFKIPAREYLDFGNKEELKIPFPNDENSLQINPLIDGTKTGVYKIMSPPYESYEHAEDISIRALNALFLYSVKYGIGIDIGYNSPKWYITEKGRDYFSRITNSKIVQDNWGITIYQDKENIKFVSGSAKVTVGRGIQNLVNSLTDGYKIDKRLKENERITLEIFNSSFFESTEISKFLSLMISLESMLDFPNHSNKVQKLITRTKRRVKCSIIPQDEKASLIGSLEQLRRVSITKSGILLTQHYLDQNQLYSGLSSSKFFKKCYNLRSKLVHKGEKTVGNFNVKHATPELSRFVADIIYQKILS